MVQSEISTCMSNRLSRLRHKLALLSSNSTNIQSMGRDYSREHNRLATLKILSSKDKMMTVPQEEMAREAHRIK